MKNQYLRNKKKGDMFFSATPVKPFCSALVHPHHHASPRRGPPRCFPNHSSLPHPSNPSAPHLFTLTTTPRRGVVLHGVFLTIKRPRLHSNPNRHSVFFLRCNPNRWNREGRLWDGEGHPWDGEVWQRHWEEEGAYCIGGEEEGFWNMHQR